MIEVDDGLEEINELEELHGVQAGAATAIGRPRKVTPPPLPPRARNGTQLHEVTTGRGRATRATPAPVATDVGADERFVARPTVVTDAAIARAVRAATTSASGEDGTASDSARPAAQTRDAVDAAPLVDAAATAPSRPPAPDGALEAAMARLRVAQAALALSSDEVDARLAAVRAEREAAARPAPPPVEESAPASESEDAHVERLMRAGRPTSVETPRQRDARELEELMKLAVPTINLAMFETRGVSFAEVARERRREARRRTAIGVGAIALLGGAIGAIVLATSGGAGPRAAATIAPAPAAPAPVAAAAPVAPAPAAVAAAPVAPAAAPVAPAPVAPAPAAVAAAPVAPAPAAVAAAPVAPAPVAPAPVAVASASVAPASVSLPTRLFGPPAPVAARPAALALTVVAAADASPPADRSARTAVPACDEVACLTAAIGCCDAEGHPSAPPSPLIAIADTPIEEPPTDAPVERPIGGLPNHPDRAPVLASLRARAAYLGLCAAEAGHSGVVALDIAITPAGALGPIGTPDSDASLIACTRRVLEGASFPRSLRGARIKFPVVIR